MNTPERQRRVLVLGGTGLLGTEVARTFLTEGTPVRILARKRPSGSGAARLEGSEMVLGSAEDAELLAKAMDGVTHVVHALGSAHPGASEAEPLAEHLRVVRTVLGVLESLPHGPEVGFTFFSSGGAVYGSPAALPAAEEDACHPNSTYGATKLAAEHLIEAYANQHGINARILRVTNAYGPQQVPGTGQGIIATFLDAALSGRPVQVFGDGTNVRDYVEVTDVARVVAALAERDGPMVLNVGSGRGHSINDVIAVVEATTGARLSVERRPPRRSDVTAIYVDTTRLRNSMDWQPVPLEVGVAAMWNAWRSGTAVVAGRPA